MPTQQRQPDFPTAGAGASTTTTGGGANNPGAETADAYTTGGARVKSATAPYDTGKGAAGAAQSSVSESLRAAMADFRKIADFLSYYVATQIDALKLTLRNIGVYAVVGLLGLIVGLGIIVTAGVLIVLGIAGMFGALFHHQWIGDLVTGLLILGTIVAVAYIVLTKLTGTFRLQTVKKYESRRQQQQANFGTDVRQQAHRQ